MPPILEFSISLKELNGKTLDLSHIGSKRFRFININSFIEHEVLEVVSVKHLSKYKHAYATISYPWQGLELEGAVAPSLGQFTVKGAESGGIINADVLRTSCRAAKLLAEPRDKCRFLWLDRICIKQEDKEDKNWQIKNMCDVYKNCGLCLVLPGGIKRLAGEEEPCTWTKRAWTLQEALVPKAVECLFSWKKPGITEAVQGGMVRIVEPFHSGAISLEWLLNAVMAGINYRFERPGDFHDSTRDDFYKFEPKIFSRTEAHILWSAWMNTKYDGTHRRDRREAALWKCALLRTSSRPVDMVFSIMRLFGVDLDPGCFKENDRQKATLALAQRILRTGGRATWLALSLELEPSPFMSSMPAFPKTEVSGGAMVNTQTGPRSVEGMVNSSWTLAGAPTGTMDDDGYLHMRCRAAAIKKKEGTSIGQKEIVEVAINGRSDKWVEQSRNEIDGPYYAVVVGERVPVPPPGLGIYAFPDPVVLMIIERHGTNPDLYHRKSFATQTKRFVAAWEQHSFCVGGPNGLRGPSDGLEVAV